jgi:hypothetical protein
MFLFALLLEREMDGFSESSIVVLFCLLFVLSYFLLAIDAGTLQLLSIVGRAVYN